MRKNDILMDIMQRRIFDVHNRRVDKEDNVLAERKSIRRSIEMGNETCLQEKTYDKLGAAVRAKVEKGKLG